MSCDDYNKTLPFNGKTAHTIVVGEYDIVFHTTDEMKYLLAIIDGDREGELDIDICGDINNLLDAPLLMAESNTVKGSTVSTFYNFKTKNGHVTITFKATQSIYYSDEAECVAAPESGRFSNYL